LVIWRWGEIGRLSPRSGQSLFCHFLFLSLPRRGKGLEPRRGVSVRGHERQGAHEREDAKNEGGGSKGRGVRLAKKGKGLEGWTRF